MTEHQIEQSQQMRARGMSWREIGRIFGVKECTVMANCDPIYAERRRQKLREWRAVHGRKEVRKPAANPAPVQRQKAAKGVWHLTSEIGRELGIVAYDAKIVNEATGRTYRRYTISLPFIPTIHKAA